MSPTADTTADREPAADTTDSEVVTQVWGLWDAGDLVSLHTTEHGARDAREVHLHGQGPLAEEDRELAERAVQVLLMHLHNP